MSLTDLVSKLFRPLALGLCVASAGCGSEQSSMGRKQCFDPSVRGKIVFSGQLDPLVGLDVDRLDIYTVNDDGDGLINLTQTEPVGFHSNQAWSPDGRFIAYDHYSTMLTSELTGIYTMNADGTSKRKISPLVASTFLEWSPDGKRIAFLVTDEGLFIMDSDGNNLQTVASNVDGFNSHPAWSPDGSKLAYDNPLDTNSEIYIVNADGSNQKNLTNNPALDQWPSWSPDGKKIAFVSSRRLVGDDFQTWIMNADGTNQQGLIDNNKIVGGFPYWSPDGNKIALSSAYDGIFLFDVNDSTLQSIVNLGEEWHRLSWSSDGQKIVYMARSGINVININSLDTARVVVDPTYLSVSPAKYVPCL